MNVLHTIALLWNGIALAWHWRSCNNVPVRRVYPELRGCSQRPEYLKRERTRHNTDHPVSDSDVYTSDCQYVASQLSRRLPAPNGPNVRGKGNTSKPGSWQWYEMVPMRQLDPKSGKQRILKGQDGKRVMRREYRFEEVVHDIRHDAAILELRGYPFRLAVKYAMRSWVRDGKALQENHNPGSARKAREGSVKFLPSSMLGDHIQGEGGSLGRHQTLPTWEQIVSALPAQPDATDLILDMGQLLSRFDPAGYKTESRRLRKAIKEAPDTSAKKAAQRAYDALQKRTERMRASKEGRKLAAYSFRHSANRERATLPLGKNRLAPTHGPCYADVMASVDPAWQGDMQLRNATYADNTLLPNVAQLNLNAPAPSARFQEVYNVDTSYAPSLERIPELTYGFCSSETAQRNYVQFWEREQNCR